MDECHECPVCLDAEATKQDFLCKHKLCVGCSKEICKLISNKCPMCRAYNKSFHVELERVLECIRADIRAEEQARDNYIRELNESRERERNSIFNRFCRMFSSMW